MARIPVILAQQPIGSSNPATNPSVSNPNAPVPPGALAPSLRVRSPAQALEHFPTRAANRIQTASRQAAARATNFPMGDGNLLTGVQFTAGLTVTLAHGLGRTWQGFLVLNRLLLPAAPRGTATLSGGSVVVTATHNLVPNRGPLAIAVAYNTISGTAGHLSVPNASRTSTTFTIQSDNAGDNSTVDWLVSPPWPGDFAGVPQGPNNATTGPADVFTITITAPYTCVSDVWVY